MKNYVSTDVEQKCFRPFEKKKGDSDDWNGVRESGVDNPSTFLKPWDLICELLNYYLWI